MSRWTQLFLKGTLLPACLISAAALQAQSGAPLVPVSKDAMPASIQGRFDHPGIDVRGNRLFAAAESAHQVLVFDLHTGRYLRSIDNIQIPHAIFVRQDNGRIYITDGGLGAVRVYDGKTYRQLATVPLKVDSDSIAYDPRTHDLYVVNGGGDANETYSMVSVVDTTSVKKIADIRIDGDTLEAMALERHSDRMYVNDASENKVVVLDRKTRQIIATWPVTMGKRNVAIALDEAHHRLFVACRDGKLVVFDTQSGKELQALQIGGGVDDAVFDPATGRIYAQCGKDGSTWVYREQNGDRYQLLGHIAEGAGAKNALLEKQTARFYVIVPPGTAPGFVDVLTVRGE